MAPPFGSFEPFCSSAPLPVCRILRASFNSCALRTSLRVRDPATLVFDLIAIATASTLIGHTASGRGRGRARRAEMIALQAAYLLQSFLDIFTTARPVFPTSVAFGFGAVQVASTTMLFVLLFGFALAGLPFMRRQRGLSLGVMLGPAGLLGAVTLGLAVTTAFATDGLVGDSGDPSVNVALYILYLGVPFLCWLGFLVLEPLAARSLKRGVPWLLIASMTCFLLGQILEFTTSTPICRASNRSIDGAFIQTALSLAAMILLYLHWMRLSPPTTTQPPGFAPHPPYMNYYPTDPSKPPELDGGSVARRNELAAKEAPAYPPHLYGAPGGHGGVQHAELHHQPYAHPPPVQELHGYGHVSELPAGISWQGARDPRGAVGVGMGTGSAVTGAPAPAPFIGSGAPQARRQEGGDQGTLAWG